MVVNRYLGDKVKELLTMFPIVAIIGSRQCGKTTLAKENYPDWSYYDLESPDDYQLITDDPLTFFSLNPDKVIIDEAQQYPALFNVLRGVIDSNRQQKGRFIITGSSSPEIVKGLSESLAGRVATVELSPLKQGEVFSQPQANFYQFLIDGSSKLKKFLQLESQITLQQSMHIWFAGGYPEPTTQAKNKTVFRKHWIDNFIGDYIQRDIRNLFTRLNIHNFRRFLSLLAQHSGHQLNVSNMARALEVSVSTIKDYLDIIHQTFVWRNLPPYTNNSLKKVQKSVKGFFRDQGILHHLLKINSLQDLQIHPVAGFSFESFVIEEIIRGLNTTMATSLDFSYYRTIDQSEIDLIIEGDCGIVPIEIKLGSTVRRTSLRALEIFIKDTGCPYGIVINRAKRVEQLTEKIIQIPVNFI